MSLKIQNSSIDTKYYNFICATWCYVKKVSCDKLIKVIKLFEYYYLKWLLLKEGDFSKQSIDLTQNASHIQLNFSNLIFMITINRKYHHK